NSGALEHRGSDRGVGGRHGGRRYGEGKAHDERKWGAGQHDAILMVKVLLKPYRRHDEIAGDVALQHRRSPAVRAGKPLSKARAVYRQYFKPSRCVRADADHIFVSVTSCPGKRPVLRPAFLDFVLCVDAALRPFDLWRQARKDRVDVAAGLEAEDGATVVQEVEFDIASATDELFFAVCFGPVLVEVLAHEVVVHDLEGATDILREAEV